ncbi:Histone demethylase UTY [Plecturocebus cupreus]
MDCSDFQSAKHHPEGDSVPFTPHQEPPSRGAGKKAAPAERVTLATRGAPPLGMSWSVGSKNVSRWGFHHFGQAGLELLTSGDLPTSASQSDEITSMSHHTGDLCLLYFSCYSFMINFNRNKTTLTAIRVSEHLLSIPVLISTMSSCVTQAGVQWHDLSSLQSSPPRLKCSFHLSLSCNWDHGHLLPCPADFSFFSFVCEMRSPYVAQAGPELLDSSNPPNLASQSTGVTGMSHCTQLH